MKKQILFIQGGGNDGFESDKELVASLQACLGKKYTVYYPELQSLESLSDFGWTRQIGKIISKAKSDIILVGHSLGASMMLKYLSESAINKRIVAIFLIATPFWSGNEDWKQGLKLQDDFVDKLPDETSIFFYHCKDDEEIPISHLEHYRQKLPQATYREIESGGHQLNNDLSMVAMDIKSL